MKSQKEQKNLLKSEKEQGWWRCTSREERETVQSPFWTRRRKEQERGWRCPSWARRMLPPGADDVVLWRGRIGRVWLWLCRRVLKPFGRSSWCVIIIFLLRVIIKPVWDALLDALTRDNIITSAKQFSFLVEFLLGQAEKHFHLFVM